MINYKLGARLLNATAILLTAQVVTKLLGTVFAIIAARKLGVADYGLWVSATSLSYLFGMVVAFGFPRLIMREVARDLLRLLLLDRFTVSGLSRLSHVAERHAENLAGIPFCRVGSYYERRAMRRACMSSTGAGMIRSRLCAEG